VLSIVSYLDVYNQSGHGLAGNSEALSLEVLLLGVNFRGLHK